MLNVKILKIIILGSWKVGKTSILNRYFDNTFQEDMMSTIGIDHRTRFFKFGGDKIRIDYIDTAGQEIYKSIAASYLKKADGVILTFDISMRESFDLIKSWIEEIETNINVNNIGKILLGNKCDLEKQRKISENEGESLALNIKCKYMEVSAKTGKNITEALEEIAKNTYEKFHSLRRYTSSFSLHEKVKKVKFKKKKDNSNLVKCCQDV